MKNSYDPRDFLGGFTGKHIPKRKAPPQKAGGVPPKPGIEIDLKKIDDNPHKYLNQLLKPNSWAHGPVMSGKTFASNMAYHSLVGKPVYDKNGREIGKIVDASVCSDLDDLMPPDLLAAKNKCERIIEEIARRLPHDAWMPDSNPDSPLTYGQQLKHETPGSLEPLFHGSRANSNLRDFFIKHNVAPSRAFWMAMDNYEDFGGDPGTVNHPKEIHAYLFKFSGKDKT